MFWAMATNNKSSPHESELPAAICRCLHEMGHRAAVVQDGEPAGLEADVLVLMVTLGDFPFYRRQLKRRSSGKPSTVLWQTDPLPPHDLSPEAESLGLKAVRWREIFKLHQPASTKWKKYLTGYRFRMWGYKWLAAGHYRAFCKKMKPLHQEDFPWQDISGVMENWRDILIGRKEGWLDHVVASTNQRRTFLVSRGIPAHFVPVGADESMGTNLGVSRDIPLGFLGSTDRKNRRTRTLEKLRKKLRERNLPDIVAQTACYGDQRCRWLNRVRILINLYNYPWDAAWIRFLMAARCGTLVVSEATDDEHPLIPGVHYVSAPWEQMCDVVAELLKHPEQIDSVTAAAEKLVREKLTLLNSVKELHKIVGSQGQ